MGAAQSAGGAATSGAKISARQLTHAIREAATRDAETARGTDLAVAPSMEELTSTNEFSFEYGDDKHTMKVMSYAPTVFARIRAAEGVSDEHFLSEWRLPEERCQTALGEGRSMAMFMKSLNMDYMCKTIAEGEVDVLRGILGGYVEHLSHSPHSLLMRFLMLLRIEANDDIGFLLIFGDSFAAAEKINERWDIKGRTPKPGKFHHFPPKHAKDVEALRAWVCEEEDDYDVPHLARTRSQTPEQLASRLSEPKVSNPPGSPQSKKVPTRKDKELTRLFWLESDVREQLLQDLNRDFDFLAHNGLMDYSILIGVRYTDAAGAVPLRQDAHLNNNANSIVATPAGSPTSSAPPAEVRPPRFGPKPSVTDSGLHVSNSRYHLGITSMLGEETYYIAIIDMLTQYNAKKASANFFKGFLWEPVTLSTVPPMPYRERISRYAELVLASPDDDLEEVARLHNAAR